MVEERSPLACRAVTVPGVNVGNHMVPVTGRIIFNQSRRIVSFCFIIIFFYPLLCLWGITFLAKEPPGFVKQNPGKDRWVVVIAFYFFFSNIFPVGFGYAVGFSPEIGNIFHD